MEAGTLRVKSRIDLLWIGSFELFGTMMLLISINLSNGLNAGPAQVCACIFFISMLTCKITGGHYNPSVTLTVYLLEGKWKKNLPIALTILVAEIIGVSS